MPLLAPIPQSLVDAATPATPLDYYPFYHTSRPNLLPWISDKYLSLLAPVLVYWLYSGLFALIDWLQLPYFERRRLHPSDEEAARNKVGVPEVLRAVVIQHVVQSALGAWWLEADDVIVAREVLRDHAGEMRGVAEGLARVAQVLLGERAAREIPLAALTQFAYWWAIPCAQFLLAMFVIDAWQYAAHRLMHENKFLYTRFHAVHHRLQVPYAFGALYNHPVEGFLLDTLGTAIAHSVAGLSTRGAILLFSLSTAKTCEDHNEFVLPWHPFQWFHNNNAYHNTHHQSFGQRKNYSQPFFTNWDRLLGTFMHQTEADELEAKYKRIRGAKRRSEKAAVTATAPAPVLARLPSSVSGSSGSDIESVTDSEDGAATTAREELTGAMPTAAGRKAAAGQVAAAGASSATSTNGTATPRSRASSVSLNPPAVVLRSM